MHLEPAGWFVNWSDGYVTDGDADVVLSKTE